MTINELKNLEVGDLIVHTEGQDSWTIEILAVRHIDYKAIVLAGPSAIGKEITVDRNQNRRGSSHYAKGLTADNVAFLNATYPEGIPAWIKIRSKTVPEAIKLMELRRKAFPETKG
jgi:hypothetical protein